MRIEKRRVFWNLPRAVRSFAALILTFSLVACASGPRLYPNKKYVDEGPERAERDIEECDEQADKYLDSPAGRKIARGAGKGAVLGGVIGAVSGAFTGNIGGGAARGAAIGGAAGGTAGALSPDEVRRRFVTKCLQDQGYDVIGWD